MSKLAPNVLSFALLVTACRNPGGGEAPTPTCASGEVLDGVVCVPEACGAGLWGELSTDVEALFVDAAAAEDGDGGQDAPFRSISEALVQARTEHIANLFVAAGDYPERLRVGHGLDGVAIQGRCAALVTVSAPEGEEESSALSVNEYAGAVRVSGLTLLGGTPLLALKSGELTLSDVELREGTWVSLDVYSGAVAHLERVSILDAVLDADGYGMGIAVFEGARLDATGLRIINSGVFGIYVDDGDIDVDGFEIREVAARTSGGSPYGIGIGLYGGSHRLISGDVADARGVGIFAAADAIEIEDLNVSDVAIDDPDLKATCVAVSGSGSLNWVGGRIERCQQSGLDISNGASVWLTDVELSELGRIKADAEGIGIVVGGASSVSLSSVVIREAGQVGIFASEESELFVEELDVIETGEDYPRLESFGIFLESDATLTGSDIRLQSNVGTGVLIKDARAEIDGLELTGQYASDGRASWGAWGRDTTVDPQKIKYSSDVPGSWGAFLDDGGVLTLSDAVISDNEAIGIQVEPGGELRMTDSTLARNQGYGLAFNGATVSLERVDVLDTSTFKDQIYAGGIGAGEETELRATDVMIDGTSEVGLIIDTSSATLTDVDVRNVRHGSNSTLAVGAAVQGSSVEARRVAVEDIEGPGISVLYGALSCVECEVEFAVFAGVWVGTGGSLVFGPDSSITQVGPDANMGGGVGVYASGRGLVEPTLLIEDAYISVEGQAAVLIDGPGSYQISASTLSCGLSRPLGDLWPQGNAVFATDGVTRWDGSDGLLLDHLTMSDNAGGAIFLDGSSVTVEGGRFQGNNHDLVQQGCSRAETPDGIEALEDVELCPTYNNRVELNDFLLYAPEFDMSED